MKLLSFRNLMSESHENIKILLKQIGFSPEENTKGIFYKKYINHKNYIIKLNIDSGEINYGNKIILGDKTTSNFKASENFVVLECVHRLLEKGYPPENLTLEKDYPLGHKTKGKLDILVTDKDGKSYLMIECKTWGAEYDKATKKTLSDGGQLLSYFQQDKSAKYLSLYTSKIENNSITYKNGIVKVEEDFLQATNTKEVFEKWNKNLKDNGIFNDWATPYNITIKAIIKGSLISLTKEDSSRIFNQFAEILRHNVVSDKPNAFNKLITLLLCKIVDEEKSDNEETAFQWFENDTNIELQKRLNDLYKRGMKDYLTKEVTDYSDQDVDNKFYDLNENQRTEIKRLITELRLKKNNEFAFKEVFNDASFEENSKVLREVIELFQSYKVRYNKKQQFLGDFFELLLNTSIKQEAGQFFTPVPLARFIVNSIPLREIINNKIATGETDFLPYIIDYAVGSGHFLTEAMDEIHKVIIELNEKNNLRPNIKKQLAAWIDNLSFDWAYKFVYGIEKDHRLVKTAKVSCFLNGDGLARIFNADGLANFKTDNDYQEKLSRKGGTKSDPKDNQQFEVLVANPPYSVSAFKNTLVDGAQSFELYHRLSDDSSEIECLFIERTKQLLKDGGYAGIILPSSILSNSGIYSDAREILLKYFKIVAITEFSSNTFMATGTNTVTLFLERRNNTDWQKIQHTVNNFFSNHVDVTCNGVENPFSKFVAHTYKTISLDDYISLVNKRPNEKIKEHELFKEYQRTFDNSTYIKNLKTKPAFKIKSETDKQAELDRLFYLEIFAIEREKLLYFILAYPQKTLLIKANHDGKNETEKEFLGYEFSNRRGHEGIRPYGAKTIQDATKLFDETNLLNSQKVNTYIYNAFLGKEIIINENLQKHINQQNLADMLVFDRVDFHKSISLAVKKKVEIESKWDIVSLSEIPETIVISGYAFKSNDFSNTKKDISYKPVLKIGNVKANRTIDLSDTQYHKYEPKFEKYLGKENDILIALTGATVGKAGVLLDNDFLINQRVLALRFIDSSLRKYVFQFLKSDLFYDYAQEEASGNSQGNLSPTQVLNYKLPLPPKNIQGKIVKEIEGIEDRQKKTEKKVIELNNYFREQFNKSISNTSQVKFNSVATLEYGASLPERDRKKGEYPVMGSNGIVGYHNEFLINSPCIIVGRKGSAGKVILIEKDCFPIDTTFYVKYDKEKINYKFLYCLLLTLKLENLAAKMGVPGLNRNDVYGLEIPLPSITIQEKIVSQIEKIETEITALQKQLETIEEEKQAVLKKYTL